jgi:hypothetical protein
MAAICAYISAVWAGVEDPVWPHLVLIPLSVLAGIAVGAGIVYEAPKYSAKAHERAFWAVVLGIAVESLCTVFLFVIDERISNAQQSKIIALESLLAPRTLSKEQFEAIQSLKTRAPEINLAVENDTECELFASLLATAFLRSGIVTHEYILAPNMRGTGGLMIFDQSGFSDNSVGSLIFRTLRGSNIIASGIVSRLPDALDMPRNVPAILVYERLSAPYMEPPYLGPAQANPITK